MFLFCDRSCSSKSMAPGWAFEAKARRIQLEQIELDIAEHSKAQPGINIHPFLIVFRII